MPGFVILFSADTLTHASVFLLCQRARFHGVAESAFESFTNSTWLRITRDRRRCRLVQRNNHLSIGWFAQNSLGNWMSIIGAIPHKGFEWGCDLIRYIRNEGGTGPLPAWSVRMLQLAIPFPNQK